MFVFQGTPGAPGAPGNTGPPGKQGELGPPVSPVQTETKAAAEAQTAFLVHPGLTPEQRLPVSGQSES